MKAYPRGEVMVVLSREEHEQLLAVFRDLARFEVIPEDVVHLARKLATPYAVEDIPLTAVGRFLDVFRDEAEPVKPRS